MATRKRHAEEEEHENHERWLVSYADMITLLMALFVILFSMSQVDLAKAAKFSEAFASSLGAGGGNVTSGGAGVLPSQAADPSLGIEEVAMAALREKEAREAATDHEQKALEAARQEISAQMDRVGLLGSVSFRSEARGLVVTVVTDQILFDLGSAELRPAGRGVLDGLAPALGTLPNPVAIEGHTDDLPISGGRYPSNWELSTERATSVLRHLVATHAVPAGRLSAAGYADQRPLASNDTDAGRRQNRRVEIVVLATAGTEHTEKS